jgi:DNA-binding CsgD family transcriptional regulator
MLGRHRMTLMDQTGLEQPTANRLQRLFGLTAAEARLALEMMRGLRLREAAEALGIEMPMARSQMVSIFVETGTQHQNELVAFLSRLARVRFEARA